MKINQWTLGLAAVGVVSMASAVSADEGKMNAATTAMSATTITGYVDTSLNWNDVGTRAQYREALPLSSGKADGFNLNVVKLSLEKAMDESEWASGYKVDILAGPDAQEFSLSGSDFAIKQAYVAMRAPLGNGLDMKFGAFDSIIGYESFDSVNNPNFTHSWGYSITPNRLVGALATYHFSEAFSISGGVANSEYNGLQDRGDKAWEVAWLGAASFTIPQDAGFLSGSALYAGAILGSGLNGVANAEKDNYYIGATINTPIDSIKVGAAYNQANFQESGIRDPYSFAAYLTFKATEKMTLIGRYEIAQNINYVSTTPLDPTWPTFIYANIQAVTGTVQYDLWKNVLSRLEVRWDKVNPTVTQANHGSFDSVGLYANFIYKF